jgi:hypothetical protein
VTSLFLHRASLLDYEIPVVRWFPRTRAVIASRAGGLASALLALAFAAALFLCRRQPVSSAEIAVLFMTNARKDIAASGKAMALVCRKDIIEVRTARDTNEKIPLEGGASLHQSLVAARMGGSN